MTALAVATDKLRRINQLWEKLRETKTDSPEYKRLINEIGVLSMEYHQIAGPSGLPIPVGSQNHRGIT
jgi:hypothetical protein